MKIGKSPPGVGEEVFDLDKAVLALSDAEVQNFFKIEVSIQEEVYWQMNNNLFIL